MPLAIHDKAPRAHAAGEAANRQGRFWEMHDKIFANPRDLSDEAYLRYAAEIGLDVDRFKQDLDSEAVKDRIDRDTGQAAKVGVTGTPSFFINGRFLSGAQPFGAFKQILDEELAGS